MNSLVGKTTPPPADRRAGVSCGAIHTAHKSTDLRFKTDLVQNFYDPTPTNANQRSDHPKVTPSENFSVIFGYDPALPGSELIIYQIFEQVLTNGQITRSFYPVRGGLTAPHHSEISL